MEHVCEMTDKYYVLYQTVLPHQFLYLFVCDIASFRLVIDIEKASLFSSLSKVGYVVKLYLIE